MILKKKWESFPKRGVKLKSYKEVKYKGYRYPVFIFKTHIDDKKKIITGGFLGRLKTTKIVLINDKIFRVATKEELDSLIKHEILHDMLKHKNIVASKELYIKKHIEIYENMTKNDLINQLTLRIRVTDIF